MLLLLWKMAPGPPPAAQRLFVPYQGGQVADRLSFDPVTLTPSDGPFTIYFVPNDRRFLAGIYVEFAGAAHRRR